MGREPPHVRVEYGRVGPARAGQPGRPRPAGFEWTFFESDREAEEFAAFLNSDRIFDCRIPPQFVGTAADPL